MEVKIFFSTDEIRKFFENNGFVVETLDFGHFAPAYHSRSEWREYLADAVIIDGKQTEASKLFSQVSEARLKQLITPSDEGMRQLIVEEFKKTLK